MHDAEWPRLADRQSRLLADLPAKRLLERLAGLAAATGQGVGSIRVAQDEQLRPDVTTARTDVTYVSGAGSSVT